MSDLDDKTRNPVKAFFPIILLAAVMSLDAADGDSKSKQAVSTSEKAIELFLQQYEASTNHLHMGARYTSAIKGTNRLEARYVTYYEFGRHRGDAESKSPDHSWIYGSMEPFKQDIKVWGIYSKDDWNRFGAFLDADSGHVFHIRSYSSPF